MNAHDVDIWISIDKTYAKEDVRGKLEAKLENFGVKFHEYSESDMLDAYPILEQILTSNEIFDRVYEFKRKTHSLAWGFHTEAINLWHNYAKSLGKVYDYIWVSEDDIGFTGNISSLIIEEYGKNKADLLLDDAKPFLIWWFWHDAGSDRYLEKIPLRKRQWGKEHIQRFSKRYLEYLHEASVEGITAWSEQSVPSLCRYKGFVCEQLRKDSIGYPFDWRGRIDEDDWEGLLADPDSQNQLFYALKF